MSNDAKNERGKEKKPKAFKCVASDIHFGIPETI